MSVLGRAACFCATDAFDELLFCLYFDALFAAAAAAASEFLRLYLKCCLRFDSHVSFDLSFMLTLTKVFYCRLKKSR